MFNKGFTLLRLIIILAIVGVLIAIPGRFYYDYVSRAKISSLLSAIRSEKIKLAEEVKKHKKVNDNHRIVIDTNHIEDNSMLIVSPIIIDDNIYWGCNRIGLEASQVPHFCRLNDFTSQQISISSQVNCQVSQGILYDETTKMFSVNVQVNGKVVSLGNFKSIKEASQSYTNYLNV